MATQLLVLDIQNQQVYLRGKSTLQDTFRKITINEIMNLKRNMRASLNIFFILKIILLPFLNFFKILD
ncbi:hypothetical protein APD01_10005 [Acinetobacter soli]|jgi:hypothetical protein|nr:hypothetical protein APD01_10005 [Acinetobacter soli]